ncbi:hypothetical protein RRF57_005352 [Xylaria bambusicola]|uniref:AB hydrolase-1 domain-containing protein n=1 Tax=Xylaria bambusicola TaxID=326684 RepID=A0AAN7UJQ6_9PEZI
MAFDGSFSATLSPSGSDTFSSHLLSSSISSLVPSTNPRVAPSQISKTYRQASQLFLTRRLPEALSTLLPLITPSTEGNEVDGSKEPAPVIRASRATRIKVWSLYLTILNAILELDSEEGKDAFGTQEWRTLCQKVRNGDVWEEVVQFGYHGVEGDVDSDVVINLATLLLSHARSQVVNQKRLENYLAASSTPNLDISRQLEAARSYRPSSRSGRSASKGAASGADTPRDLNARVKILELYTLHVLLRNNEWDYAREFISVSSVLDEERREAFLQALQSLQEEQQAQQQREREEQQRQEDNLRKDIEDARRLRAENEAREHRRLEEERVKREASEVDYGIEQSQHPSTPRKARSTSNGSALSKATPSSSASKAKKATAAPSLGTRAAMVIANLRIVIEQLGSSLRMNPMLLMRLMAFIVGIIVVFGRRDLRERMKRILGTGWNKVKQTAGMGVKAKERGLEKLTSIYNLGAPITILLEARALKAVESVRYPFATAHHALVLVVAEAALVTDADERRGAHMAGPESESIVDQGHDPTIANAHQKRKASSPIATKDTSPSSPKRTRLESNRTDERHEPRPRSTKEAGLDRREMARQEEKKRGRRLLGGLMNTLSQASAGPQHRKRQDIERRQQAKSTQQRAEEDRLRMQKLSKLEAARKVEQLKFDEQVMKTRHADMLAKARYLQTKAAPRIFYLPWELTRRQEETIRDQIYEAEKIIDKEISGFQERKSQRLKDLGVAEKPSLNNKEETVGKLNNESPTDKSQPVSTNRPPSRATNKVGPEKESDRVDDVMIEEDEDTFAEVGGFKYHYMLAKPTEKPMATVFLIHGWPDLGMGWRYQVPYLLSLNLQVVVPDMLGYGQTDAPDSYEEYRMKKMTAHMVEIVKSVTDQPIILGGHDWGALFVWRLAQYYPELIRCVFSVCVPYLPPSSVRLALPDLVAKMPNFTYQLQLAGGGAEEIVAKSPERIRGFINGIFGGTTPEGKPVFSINVGVLEENIDSIGQSPLMSKEMTDYYVQEFSRHGIHGPCNWYRTRELNGDDEEVMAKDSFKYPMPAMLLMADQDAALPAWMAIGQEQYFAAGLKLETLEGCSHWAMIQKPAEVNKHIGDFIKSVLGDEIKAAL